MSGAGCCLLPCLGVSDPSCGSLSLVVFFPHCVTYTPVYVVGGLAGCVVAYWSLFDSLGIPSQVRDIALSIRRTSCNRCVLFSLLGFFVSSPHIAWPSGVIK